MRISKFLNAALAAFVAGTAAILASAAVAPAVAQDSGETVLFTGEWAKKSFNSRGVWSIVEEGDERFVVLSDDFRTRGAPDLKIFLSPKAAGELNGDNATDGSFLVAELSSNRGGQRYALPADLDLSQYASIIIHCEQYSKLWSVATLA